MKEKRKAKRVAVVEKFAFCVSVPRLGATKLKVIDVSDMGIGFDVDTLGEFRLQKDEKSKLQFYVNQSLYLELEIQVVRLQETDGTQNVGAVFLNTQSATYKTFLTLVSLIDQLAEHGELA